MATARRPKAAARREAPRRQSSSATWPPGPTSDRPWYVEDWSFGEAPVAEEAEQRSSRKVWLVIVILIVTLAVAGAALFLLNVV